MSIKRFAVSLLPLTMIAGPASAALIRITPTGVAPNQQAITDPVPIGGSGFRLSYWSDGNASNDLVDPVLLILATPGATTAPSLSVTNSYPNSLATTITLGGPNVFGGTWNTSTGAAGTFDSSDSGSVYSSIGLLNANGSQNYANWSGASSATSWNLFVYSLAFNPNFDHGDWVELATTLPTDSFVVGYGCKQLASGSTIRCRNSGSVEDVPFTFAGHVSSVPEPGTLSLLGVGLLVAGFSARRERPLKRRV